jgi:outer membrane protein OmpA-like peptidoglycan-associated protein/tetratricopeptide (TPR) repeat protein
MIYIGKSMKTKNITLIVLLILAITKIMAQPMRATRPEYSLKVAENSKNAFDYYNALEWYEKYYEQTKDRSVAYEIAQLHMLLKDYAKAETWYARVLQRDKKATGEVNTETRYFYALMLKMNEKYDEAILTFEDYIKEASDEKRKKMAQTEIEGAKMAMKMKENTTLIVENAGNKVNSPNNEYSPSVSADGTTLYFTAFRSEKAITLDGKEGDYYAKVMKATRSPRGNWIEPEPIEGDINRPLSNHGGVYITPIGNTMYFTRIELTGNEVTKSTLYMASKTGNGWSAANEMKGLNGNYIIKHPSVGELYGKEVLFFAANMEGTKGGFDVFYATNNGDGTFGAPVNCGDIINTIGEEETPYYKDGKLYFSSTGHPNIGGFDVFSTNWNGTEWSKPENLGKGINSSANDRYYNQDADGNIYLVSNRPGGRSLKSRTCCEDIYVIKKEPIKLDLIVTATDGKKPLGGLGYRFSEIIKGAPGTPDEKIADTYTSDLMVNKAYRIITSKVGYYNDTTEINTVGIKQTTTVKKQITLRPLPTITAALKARAVNGDKALTGVTFNLMEMASKISGNKTTDIFTTGLALNKTYRLVASKSGFTSDTVTFNTNDIKETTEIEKVLNLKTKTIVIKRNEPIALQNIYYKLDKFAANEQEMENFSLASQSLDYLYNIMTKYNGMVIELSSHTDSRGPDAYNKTLSQKRADGAKLYLTNKGIDASRIVPKGYGETQLVNQCKSGVKCTEEEHLANRRTEFKIISGPTTIEITEQQSATNN